MKNFIYFLALFFTIIYASSCNETGNDISPPTPPPMEDTISDSTYNVWISNWDSLGKSYIANQDSILRYFTMPKIDLSEFLNSQGNGRDTAAAARFDLGIELKLDPITQKLVPTPHLMLLGVDRFGKAMTDAKQMQFIYDVSKPCPNSCGHKGLPDKN